MSDIEEYDESEKGLSIASLVLGIVGLVISCTPVGFAASILAIIFAGICINKKQGVKGFVTAGLILGIVSLALWAIFIIIMVLGFVAATALMVPAVNSLSTV